MSCALACSFENTGSFNPAKARIKVFESRKGYGVPVLCVQCGKCVEACPSNAIRLNDTVTIDLELCVGCGSCVEACPIKAVWLLNGKAVKCSVCSENPPCVKYCPRNALTLKELSLEEASKVLSVLSEELLDT